MRRSLLALAMVCVAALSGCGDDDADETNQSSATTAAASGTTATGGRFCELFRSYNDRFSRTTSVKDADELRNLLRDARSDVNEAKDVAPLAIKADTEIVARVLDEYVDALEEVDFEVTRLPIDVAQTIASPDFLGAAQKTQSYVATACR